MKFPPKKINEKKEPRGEERREARMPPAKMRQMERREGPHMMAKGGMVKKAGRGC